MFSARLRAASGSKLSATLVVEYFDDRVNKTLSIETYRNVDIATNAKRTAWITSVIRAHLLSLKAGEEDAQLQSHVGTILDAI